MIYEHLARPLPSVQTYSPATADAFLHRLQDATGCVQTKTPGDLRIELVAGGRDHVFAFADPGEFEAALRQVRSHGIAVYSATAINWAVFAVLSLASAAALAVAWG